MQKCVDGEKHVLLFLGNYFLKILIILAAPSGLQSFFVPRDQEWKQCPLKWKCRVLSTRTQGKSYILLFLLENIMKMSTPSTHGPVRSTPNRVFDCAKSDEKGKVGNKVAKTTRQTSVHLSNA